MYELKYRTPLEWSEAPLKDFDSFLIDHAACERKASAVGLSFVVRYPDRKELIDPMIQFAREELEHFHQVYRVLSQRGLSLSDDKPDDYVNGLLREVRTGTHQRLLDRLLVSSIIEARGTERLGIISQVVTEPELQSLYLRLTRAEARHKDLFYDLALLYFDKKTLEDRLSFFLELEARVIASLPWQAAVH